MRKGNLYRKGDKIYLCEFSYCTDCKKKHYFFFDIEDFNNYIPSEDINIKEYLYIGKLPDVINKGLKQ